MTTFVGTPIDNTSAEAKAAVRSHIRGSGLLLTGRVISLALTSLTQVLIVRHLSTDNYAAWAYAFSVVLLLQVLSSFGFQEAVPRFVSIYHERQDYPRMFGTMLLSVGLIALSSAVVIAAFFCFPDKLPALFHQQKESLVVLSVLIFMVPFEGFDGVLMGVFASLANPRSIFFRRYILAPSLRLAVVVLLIAGKASVSFLAYGYLASSVLGILIYTWILLRLLHREGLLADLRSNGVHVPYRELLSFVAPMMTSDLLLVLTDSGLALLIGYYCGLREAALFRIVIPLAALNHIVGNMTGILYMPAAARLFANNDRDGLGHLYWRTATWVAVLTFPVFVATFAFARPLTIALYGERYADAAVILAIMSAGSYFHAMWGFNGVTLKALNKARHVVACNLLTAAITVICALILIPRYGALGAAITDAIAAVVLALLRQAALRLAVGIEIFDIKFLAFYLFIVAAAAPLLIVRSLVGSHLYAGAILALLSLVAVLLITRKELRVPEIFPESIRLPLVWRFFA
jgi:O-antigen/teichoic acid export membrane protein